MGTARQTAQDAARDYLKSIQGDAGSAPESSDELRVLWAIAFDIRQTAERCAERLNANVNLRANFQTVDPSEVALMMAETLDWAMASEAMGVIVAELKANDTVMKEAA
jgi:hypothetical protein